ncbi:hypothetical protein [Streptomyces sp. NPDC127108]|uniref:hypothetical protein n=1 Tax=Streptomyces sp. NPDC127108 TaxID=3345361 RepID=UPI00362E581A
MTPAPTSPGRPTFAGRLNLLFEAAAQPNPDHPGEYVEYTNQQVADEINRRHGVGTITAEYIRRLRREGGPNPTVSYMSVLADFFDMPLDVFNLTSTEANTKASRVVAELERLLSGRRQVGNETLAGLARSASRLSPQGQARVAQFASKLEEVEQMERQGEHPDR